MSARQSIGKHYFCENCSQEVEESDELCRHCGAVFVAIKCPRCGYRGKQHHFSRGCPICGFLSGDSPVKDGRSPSIGVTASHHDVSRVTSTPRTRRFARAGKPLPDWWFWIAMGGLAAAFAVLAVLYMRL